METGLNGLDEVPLPQSDSTLGDDAMRGWLDELVPFRILRITQALRTGMTPAEVAKATGWNIWFLERIQAILDAETMVRDQGIPDDAYPFLWLKSLGFSDRRLGQLANLPADDVTTRRLAHNIVPSFKRIDTCAA